MSGRSPHVDKELQRGEPEPSPQDAYNTSHIERDTTLQDL